MSKGNLSIQVFKSLETKTYLNKYCTTELIHNSDAGVFLIDYKMSASVCPCVFIPLKNLQDASLFYDMLIDTQRNLFANSGLTSIRMNKIEDQKKQIIVTVMKGSLLPEVLEKKATIFFEANFNLKLIVSPESDISREAFFNQKVQKNPNEAIKENRSSLREVAKTAEKACIIFNNRLLPAIKKNRITRIHAKELCIVTERFKAFNQMILQGGQDRRKQFSNLIAQINKAAAVIIQLKP